MTTIKTVLCPTDFSDSARQAFDLACSLAQAYRARLILTHIVDVEYGEHSYGGNPVEVRPADYPEQMADNLKRLQVPDPSVPVEYVVAEGQAVDEILRLAREKQADLIVIATHGLTGIKRLVLGSVAEQVIRRADCPVLTTRLRDE